MRTRLVVDLFSKCMAYIPCSSTFYWRAVKGCNPPKFSNQELGWNMLSTIVKQFWEEAAFAENFTNYSRKVTCATSLFQSGVDEQLIMQQTGHHSDAARPYKRPSRSQGTELSSILQPPAQRKPFLVKKEAGCMGSKPPEGIAHSNPSCQVLAPICPPDLDGGMDSPTCTGKVCGQAIQLSFHKGSGVNISFNFYT